MFAATKPWADAPSGVRVVTPAEEPAAKGREIAALERVSLVLGGTKILDEVSFEVAAGEAVCLVGPSGGGKSTILNLLAGLVEPTAGRVRWEGRPVAGPGPERAVVFQDAALFPWLTLEDNVGFPLEVAGVARDERRARVEELLRLVHLLKFRRAYPHELSGGMRQRGAIARALATKPKMVLFDEPFAALDGQMRELLQNEVERIVRVAGTTMVFVTHQIEEAVRLGDRVVLVGARPGRVLGDVAIDLPRPRRAGDAHAVRLVQALAADIRAEVEKVAREEADDAWSPEPRGKSSSGADGDDPRRHLGGGI
ncbi:MAG: ABC transporter ATP-binding protein [Pseudolabrys sp.]|nr:ABC transporter ATP-binding protein [Labilithrix sp.]MBX3552207.1 ABC transporter ATP-binding protein [Pseudolabrys sp.]